MSAKEIRSERIDMRVTAEVGELLQRAAVLTHQSKSAFVITAAAQCAERVVREHQAVILPAAAFDRFFAALDEPAKPIPAMVEMFQRATK